VRKFGLATAFTEQLAEGERVHFHVGMRINYGPPERHGATLNVLESRASYGGRKARSARRRIARGEWAGPSGVLIVREVNRHLGTITVAGA
jgi:hypothetical protein